MEVHFLIFALDHYLLIMHYQVAKLLSHAELPALKEIHYKLTLWKRLRFKQNC